jgi:hypothetical protein
MYMSDCQANNFRFPSKLVFAALLSYLKIACFSLFTIPVLELCLLWVLNFL